MTSTEEGPLDADAAENEGHDGPHGGETGRDDTRRHFDGCPADCRREGICWVVVGVSEEDTEAVGGSKDDADSIWLVKDNYSKIRNTKTSKRGTYKKPRQKAKVTPNFSGRRNCSFQT